MANRQDSRESAADRSIFGGNRGEPTKNYGEIQATITKLFIDEPEAIVAANIETSGMGTYAPYVANKSNEHMEIRMKDCEQDHRIAFRNRVYFCDLEKALAARYDGCGYCMHEHHHR